MTQVKKGVIWADDDKVDDLRRLRRLYTVKEVEEEIEKYISKNKPFLKNMVK